MLKGSIFLSIFLLAAGFLVASGATPDTCDPSPCQLHATFEPEDLAIAEQADLPVTLQTNLTIEEAENMTVTVEPDEDGLIDTDEPEIIPDTDTGLVKVRIVLKGGKKYGTTVISVSMKWKSNGHDTVAVLKKTVLVARPPQNINTQNIVEYIVMGIALTIIFMSGCETNFGDFIKWGPYIVIAILVQCVLLPLCGIAFFDLFGVKFLSKMGILSILNSPASFLVVPVAVLVKADAGLAAFLVIVHHLIANAVLPIWVQQYDSETNDIVIGTSDIPYDVMCILFFLGGCLLLLGMLVRRYQPVFAEIFAKFSGPVSVICLLIAFIGSVCGGTDLLNNLDWKSGLLIFIWPLIILLIILVVAVTSKSPTSTTKACAIFLLIKSYYIPSVILRNAYHPPQLEIALVPAYFVSLVTLIIGAIVIASYWIYSCCMKKGSYNNVESKLVISIDPEDELNAPVPEDPLSGVEYGNEHKTKYDYGYDQEAVAGAVVSAGMPVVALF